MILLRAYLAEKIRFTANTETLLHDLCTVENYPKKTYLVERGQICKKVFFIEKGVSRAYYLQKGKEVTSFFAKEGQFVTANNSLLTGQSSDYNIQLIEDSQVISINYEKLQIYINDYPKLQHLVRLITHELFLRVDERIKKILFLTPEERYLNFLKDFPNLSLRVPLGHIASYIGISQETLSRVRAKAKGRFNRASK